LDGVAGAGRALDRHLGARTGHLVFLAADGDAAAVSLLDLVGECGADSERKRDAGENDSFLHNLPPWFLSLSASGDPTQGDGEYISPFGQIAGAKEKSPHAMIL